MDQSLSVQRKFTFAHDVKSDWLIDNIPLRFPNARFFDYNPIHVERGIINIDIRRNLFKDCIDPPYDTLARVLQQHLEYPLCITISWKAAAFSASRLDSPPWKELVGPHIRPESIAPLKPYFNLLVYHIRRWKAFRLFSPLINYMQEEFSRIPRGGAPSLESLIVMDVEQYSEIQGLSGILLPLRKCSPNFRQLLLLDNRDRAITGVAPDEFSLSIKENFPFLPYERLTSLRVDYILSAMDAWCLLIRANQLVECVFSSLTGTSLISAKDAKVVTFRSLQYLKLCNYEGDFARHKATGTIYSLLKNISTPNLKKLVLKCEDLWNAKAFATFITQSACTLESLHLIKMGFNARQLVSCLELAGDSLTDLLLQETEDTIHPGNYFLAPHFVKHFTYQDPRKHDGERPCLCPKLQLISIGDTSLHGPGVFGEALYSRIGVTPFSEVRILCTDMVRKGTNIQEVDARTLQKLMQRGIRVFLVRDPCDGL